MKVLHDPNPRIQLTLLTDVTPLTVDLFGCGM